MLCRLLLIAVTRRGRHIGYFLNACAAAKLMPHYSEVIPLQNVGEVLNGLV